MIVVRENVWSQLISFTAFERRWLDDYTSCEVDAYRAGKWGRMTGDERFRMFDILSNRFPSGFVPMLAEAAVKEGLVFDVQDRRGPPPVPIDDFADLGWLRDYQEAAVWAAAEAGRGLIKAPTASGKTEICVGLTRALPCEWLFVVHRSDLTGQAALRFKKRTGETAGEFVGGEWRRGSSNFTVSTFQAIMHAKRKKLAGLRDLAKGVQGIMVDECHAQPADSFYAVSMGLDRAYFRFGVSGTPLDRGPRDTLRTIGALGPIVYRIRTRTLADKGLLSVPKIFMVPCKQEGTTQADWRTTYQQLVVNSAARNTVLVKMAELATKPALLFVDEMAQGEWLVQELGRRGIRSDFVNGKHWNEARLGMVRNLVEGKLDVLVCSVIFQEGIDIPELEAVIHGGGKASVVGTLQRMGRGMRTAAGKTGFEVWDVWDTGQKWLHDHALARRKAYQKEGHKVTIGWPPVQQTLALADGGGVLIR